MNWADWLIVSYFCVGLVACILDIGKDRDPLTPVTVAGIFIFHSLLIGLLMVSHWN